MFTGPWVGIVVHRLTGPPGLRPTARTFVSILTPRGIGWRPFSSSWCRRRGRACAECEPTVAVFALGCVSLLWLVLMSDCCGCSAAMRMTQRRMLLRLCGS